MKFSSVVVFGDSHVVGTEIIDGLIAFPGATWRELQISDAKTKPLAWPAIVADHFGIPCYNYAMSGGSNNRSLRLLTERIAQHTDSLVLFGYTNSARTEFYLPDTDQAVFRDGDFVQLIPQMCEGFWCTSEQSRLAHLYYKHFYHPSLPTNLLPTLVQSVCSAHHAACIHVPIFDEWCNIDHSTALVFDFDKSGSYLNWCAMKNFVPKIYGHYGQDAHAALAKILIDYLENCSND